MSRAGPLAVLRISALVCVSACGEPAGPSSWSDGSLTGASPSASAAAGGSGSGGISSSASVTIYGAPEDRATLRMEESLKLRGLAASVVSATDRGDIEALGLLERAQEAGLADAGSVRVPFAEVDGRLTSAEALRGELSRLPVTNPRIHEDPYILIYGTRGCAIEQRGRQELDDNGIPYEFHEVSDPRFGARLDALVDIHGSEFTRLPVFEINGRLFSRPSLDVVRENFR